MHICEKVNINFKSIWIHYYLLLPKFAKQLIILKQALNQMISTECRRIRCSLTCSLYPLENEILVLKSKP